MTDNPSQFGVSFLLSDAVCETTTVFETLNLLVLPFLNVVFYSTFFRVRQTILAVIALMSCTFAPITAGYELSDVLCYYNMPNGQKRVFFQVQQENTFQLYTKIVGEEDYEAQRVCTPYDRYDDGYDFYEDGLSDPFFYCVSPDKKNLYVVASIHANSNGWTIEYQLYKINCATLDVKMIAECAAIKVTENGFVIAKCRCTNSKRAKCTADEIWVMHDEYLDWNGMRTKKGTKEYGYKEMERRYSTPGKEYWYLRGFKQCAGHPVYD